MSALELRNSVTGNIQHHAAHWVCGSKWDPSVFTWTKSSCLCLEEVGMAISKMML